VQFTFKLIEPQQDVDPDQLREAGGLPQYTINHPFLLNDKEKRELRDFLRDVLGIIAQMQQAAVDLRMQGLDASIEHFGKTGVFRDVFYGDTGFADDFGGTARGEQFDSRCVEHPGEIDQTGLVGDRKQRALNPCHIEAAEIGAVGEKVNDSVWRARTQEGVLSADLAD
jgi:hypothetical protein